MILLKDSQTGVSLSRVAGRHDGTRRGDASTKGGRGSWWSLLVFATRAGVVSDPNHEDACSASEDASERSAIDCRRREQTRQVPTHQVANSSLDPLAFPSHSASQSAIRYKVCADPATEIRRTPLLASARLSLTTGERTYLGSDQTRAAGCVNPNPVSLSLSLCACAASLPAHHETCRCMRVRVSSDKTTLLPSSSSSAAAANLLPKSASQLQPPPSSLSLITLL